MAPRNNPSPTNKIYQLNIFSVYFLVIIDDDSLFYHCVQQQFCFFFIGLLDFLEKN